MQDLSTPLDAGSDPCVYHTELDQMHRTRSLVYTIGAVFRPIDPFCEAIASGLDPGGIETVVTNNGRVVCRPPGGQDG